MEFETQQCPKNTRRDDIHVMWELGACKQRLKTKEFELLYFSPYSVVILIRNCTILEYQNGVNRFYVLNTFCMKIILK